MSARAILLLFVAATLLHDVSAQNRPIIDWLKNNKDTTKAAELLEKMYPKPMPAKMTMTMLVPTNAAIEAFRRDMGLTPAQLNDRPILLDMMLAYHIIPGYQAKELKLAKSPAMAATGDINYVLNFYDTAQGVSVEDSQGNKVALSKPVLINGVSLIVINKVLMSGAYFFTGKDALSYYKTWSEAAAFAKAVGYPEGTGREQDMTFFVPDNTAMKAAAGTVSKLSEAQKKNVFLYHTTSPARSIPTDFKDGKISTNFKGHDITTAMTTDSSNMNEITGKPKPMLTLASETGNKATANVYNVFVGRSIWQGINAVLIPKLDGAKVQTESGRNRRMLLGWATQVVSRGRSLLDRSSSFDSQTYTNTVAAENTARAIEAAATGKIPTSYATRYGSAQAKATTANCFNCISWA